MNKEFVGGVSLAIVILTTVLYVIPFGMYTLICEYIKKDFEPINIIPLIFASMALCSGISYLIL